MFGYGWKSVEVGEGPKSVERLDSLVWLESLSAGEAYGCLTNDNSMRCMVAEGWCSWTCWVRETCYSSVNLKLSFLSVLLSSEHFSLSRNKPATRYFTFEPYFKVNEPHHMTVTMQN